MYWGFTLEDGFRTMFISGEARIYNLANARVVSKDFHKEVGSGTCVAEEEDMLQFGMLLGQRYHLCEIALTTASIQYMMPIDYKFLTRSESSEHVSWVSQIILSWTPPHYINNLHLSQLQASCNPNAVSVQCVLCSNTWTFP